MNLVKRVEGVFFSPQTTFPAVAAKPVWWDVLIIVVVSLVIYTSLIMPFASQDAMSYYPQNRGGEPPPDISQMPKWILLIGVVIGLFGIMVMIFLSSGVIYLVGRFVSTEGDFQKILAVFLHASLVDSLLGNLVRLAIVFIKKTSLVSTGLAMFFPNLPARSFPFVVLSVFDFFRLWMFGILAFGLSAIFKVNMKKALLISFLSWLILSLITVGFSGLGMVLQRR